MAETPRERTARLRREATAANRAFREAMQQPPQQPPEAPPKAPPAPPPDDGEQYYPGDPNRQDWDRARWIYTNPTAASLIFRTEEYIKGNDVWLSFTCYGRHSALKKYKRHNPEGDVFIVGARINKSSWIQLLQEVDSLPFVVERIRRNLPRGSVLRVLSVAIGEALPWLQ